jgi:hypothetical protein
MNSVGAFLTRLRIKKELADARRVGAALGNGDSAKHFEVNERAGRTAAVFLAADVFGAPREVVLKLGQVALSAAAERDEYFEQEKIQIANAFNEVEQRDRDEA